MVNVNVRPTAVIFGAAVLLFGCIKRLPIDGSPCLKNDCPSGYCCNASFQCVSGTNCLSFRDGGSAGSDVADSSDLDAAARDLNSQQEGDVALLEATDGDAANAMSSEDVAAQDILADTSVSIPPLCANIVNQEDPLGCLNERRCDDSGHCVSRFSEFIVPTADSGLAGMTAGPDGNLWFTESTADQIGRITPQGVFSEFSASGHPNRITTGPDGRLWFTFTAKSALGTVTTAGVVTSQALPNSLYGETDIVTGPDGNLWHLDDPYVVRTTVAGQTTLFQLPDYRTFPWGLAVGSDGNLWFAELATGIIGRITTSGAITVRTTPVAPSRSSLWAVANGPDGNLWFTAPDASQIGRLNLSDASITMFDVNPQSPTDSQAPAVIVAGPQNSLWFTTYVGNAIVRMTTDGVPTRFAIPSTGAGPAGIAVGSDGAIWFIETLANKIGRFQPN